VLAAYIALGPAVAAAKDPAKALAASGAVEVAPASFADLWHP
jgi:hypothetical protein